MSDKNFFNIHLLISHNPSCLNRDDMNMQKSALFGGTRRVRISSQCLKRALRKSKYYLNNIGEPSIRTRDLNKLKDIYAKELEHSYPPDFVADVIDRVAGAGVHKKKDKDKEETGGKDDKSKQAVAPWSVAEVEKICQIVQQAQAEGVDEKKLQKIMESQPLLSALTKSLDIALSGRMATSGLMQSVDGSMALSHAITTHAVDADIDWFTAVDDLIENEGETGAGHLNTQEFSAGVFYRYASLNLNQLATNMGEAGRTDTLAVAAHLVHLLSTVVPSAKQNSFAAFNPADLVMASFSDMPLSAANAFEQPVEKDGKGGFLKPSIQAFENYMGRVYTGFGLDDRKAVFSLWDTELEPQKKTLEDLKAWVRTGGV